jgi:hypothetical protein
MKKTGFVARNDKAVPVIFGAFSFSGTAIQKIIGKTAFRPIFLR